MIPKQPTCFVHLGKYGDLMIMLPGFKAIADRDGVAPICYVSSEFSKLFDGTSYVVPRPVNLHWWKGVGEARRIAESEGHKPIVVKWWDEPGAQAPRTLENGKTIQLKIHGRQVIVPANEWDSYQASQWRYAGFTMEQMIKLPLVFDRRDDERESDLRQFFFKTSLPKVLVSFSKNGTSPFRHGLQIMNLLTGMSFEVIDLAAIKAHRIYDLLGLYDHAAGLITSDTATLHLAAASNIPYIAFVNNGGAGSIPKGNCILAVRYAHVMQKIGSIAAAMKRFEK